MRAEAFFLDLTENQRGRYLSIHEKGMGGRKETILVPVEAFADFAQAVERLVNVAGELESGVKELVSEQMTARLTFL